MQKNLTTDNTDGTDHRGLWDSEFEGRDLTIW